MALTYTTENKKHAGDELWRVFYRFTVFLPPIGG